MNASLSYMFWFLAVVAFIYVAMVLMTYFFQRNMMYFPGAFRMSLDTSAIKNIKEVTIKTEDGIELTSWYLPALKLDMPTIISFHGNASTMEWQSERLLPFANKGYGILIASYRGYNGNEGKPTEEDLYEDARAHIKFLMKDAILPDKIILYGESLGSGVATQMAFEQSGFKALILESPYTSTVNVAKGLYPYLPISLLMKDRYENLSKIKGVYCPVIIAHGQRDRVVPYVQGKALFDAANDPKIFVDVPDGAHANLGDFGVTEKYLLILSNLDKGI